MIGITSRPQPRARPAPVAHGRRGPRRVRPCRAPPRRHDQCGRRQLQCRLVAVLPDQQRPDEQRRARSRSAAPSRAIGEDARYNCSGTTVDGRSYDMIHRNYFAHPILGCGQYVFSMMQAFGIHYKSAGENIGWVSGNLSTGAAASYINGAFMNSADHRSNILDSRYTEMGVGSDESASGVVWTGVFPGSERGYGCSARSSRRSVRRRRPRSGRRSPGRRAAGTRPKPAPPVVPGRNHAALPGGADPDPLRIPGPAGFPRTSRLPRSPSTRASCPTASNPFSKHFLHFYRGLNPNSAQHRRAVHRRP